MMFSLGTFLVLTLLTRPGYTGRWVALTTDSDAYQKVNGLSVPITGRDHVILEVKVRKGAEIQLLESESGAWTYYKLGGDDNEWSAMAASELCDGLGCTWVDYVNAPSALDSAQFRPFWVSWDAGGNHRIGTGDIVGDNVYLSGRVAYFDVNLFQVSNFDAGITAEWRFLIDEPPVFTNPSALGNTVVDVNEDVSIGSSIYTVAGTDQEGDGLNFTVDSHTDVFQFAGTALKTIQLLDYETVISYNVLISVSDGRNIQQTMLTLRITDAVDETPVITLPSSLSIPEEQPVGSVVGNLYTVSDEDKGDNLTYTIKGTHSHLFNIAPDTGILTIAERIDRDQAGLTSITFDLEVTDSSNLTASQTITVTIKDVNDNDPVFSATMYTVNVAENTASGTSLVDFVVSDADEDANAAVNISIAAGDTAKFKMSGSQLQTSANPLDYEAISEYRLTVVAVNNDNIRKGTTFVTVKVTPVNEAGPVFTAPAVDGSNQFPGQNLSEDVPLNHVIPFTASDADLGVDGDVTFSIVSVLDSTNTDGRSSFSIDPSSGNLTVIQLLDRDVATGGILYYDVTIRISDGGSIPRTDDGTIRLTLVNVNDNAPQFSSTFYTASVSEDTEIGAVAGTVAATDADGDGITYTVEGSWSSVFDMNGTDVITSSFLDYATTPLYSITIRANDGKFQTDVMMTLSVAQVVSTAFEIIAKPNVKMVEEQGVGTVIAGVFKTVGNTGAVTYSLEGLSAGYLSVDSVSGVLAYGSQRIDRDGVNGMTTLSGITLKGVDGAGEVATADLSFIIIDINDNAPVTTNMAPTAEIRENSGNNQLVIPFTLSDPDVGSNSDISLCISSGDIHNVFSVINHDLYVNGGNVDYEALSIDKAYNLVLLAKDNPTAATAMTTAIRVTITVVGENEHTPYWVSPAIGQDSSFSDVSVLETATLGETIQTFAAADGDDGNDGRITYSVADIRDPSGSQVKGKFEMTSDGKLVVGSGLDYDADTGGVPYYMVKLVASDSSTTIVRNVTGNIKIILQNVETENQILVPQAVSSDPTSELWVMRALVAVFGAAILVLGSIMLKSILSGGTGTSSPSTAKVAPKETVETPVTLTPSTSLESVHVNNEGDIFSWIEKGEAVTSQPPGSTMPVRATEPFVSSQLPDTSHYLGSMLSLESDNLVDNDHQLDSTLPRELILPLENTLSGEFDQQAESPYSAESSTAG